ncbi:MAG: undecaprenyl-diphosphate phosphatase [Pseudomonadota bacterium]
MTELLHSMFLGFVQGATEFLPVSSSGHLALLELFFGVESDIILLNVLLHAGTLAAICLYYRKSLLGIARTGLGLLRPGSPDSAGAGREDRALIVNILAADFVTGCVALLLYGPVETISTQGRTIGALLVITAVLLAMTPMLHASRGRLTWKHALLIGFFQGIAVLPGISRSGATIFAALLFLSDRKEAVRFSFLIAVPVLFGALVLEAVKEFDEIAGNLLLYIPGAAVAFVSGWIFLCAIEKITVGRRLHWFAFYLVPVGLALAFIA